MPGPSPSCPDFSTLPDALRAGDPDFARIFEKIDAQIVPSANPKHIHLTAQAVYALIRGAIPAQDTARLHAAQSYVVACLLKKHAPRLIEQYKAESIFDLLISNFSRIARSLTNGSNPYEDYDSFIKDISYAYGEIIPCGAQGIALTAIASPKALLSPAALRAYGTNPFRWVKPALNLGKGWARTHTDSRMLQDFNEQGWDTAFRRMSALLETRPWIFGIVATAWFYDPQIPQISPKLAYLQERPLERGAFLFRHGVNPYQTQWAIERSPTRRKLYEEGRYQPQCYSMLWPRKALLSWARKTQEKEVPRA